jgi:hypothetical protein
MVKKSFQPKYCEWHQKTSKRKKIANFNQSLSQKYFFLNELMAAWP